MSVLVHHQTYIAKRTKPLPWHNNFGPQSCLFPLTLPECIVHPPLLDCLGQRSVTVSPTHHSLMKVILCHNITYGIVEVSVRLQSKPDIECLNISPKRFERYGSWSLWNTRTPFIHCTYLTTNSRRWTLTLISCYYDHGEDAKDSPSHSFTLLVILYVP